MSDVLHSSGIWTLAAQLVALFGEVIQLCKRCLHHLSPAVFWHGAMGWPQKHEPREKGRCYHCVVNARKG